MDNPQTPQAVRAAKFLNVLINIIIGCLLLFLTLIIMIVVWVHFDPSLQQTTMDTLGSKPGEVPTFGALLMGGGLGTIIILIAYIYIAFVVKGIVKTTIDGNPFVTSNISRLRKTWVIIVVAEIVRMIAFGVVSESGSNGTSLDGFDIETNLQAWFLAFVIAIMAEVFRIGLELRRDQELTV